MLCVKGVGNLTFCWNVFFFISSVLVFNLVNTDFIIPANNLSERANKVIEDYEVAHSKLHDIRMKINNATADANFATTKNAVNSKELIETQDKIKSKKHVFFAMLRGVASSATRHEKTLFQQTICLGFNVKVKATNRMI